MKILRENKDFQVLKPYSQLFKKTISFFSKLFENDFSHITINYWIININIFPFEICKFIIFYHQSLLNNKIIDSNNYIYKSLRTLSLKQ